MLVNFRKTSSSASGGSWGFKRVIVSRSHVVAISTECSESVIQSPQTVISTAAYRAGWGHGFLRLKKKVLENKYLCDAKVGCTDLRLKRSS